MAKKEYLREYLSKLGFEIDDAGFKQLESKTTSFLKQWQQIGKIVAISAGAMSAAIVKAASDIEKLYFSAERAGTSVGQLMALRFGAEQIGVGAENAAAMIERMGSALRSNPGLHAFFTQLGLEEVSDNTRNFISLVTKLKEMSDRGGHVMATQIAAQFGIDEPTLLMLEKNLPDLIRQQEKQREIFSRLGVDIDKVGPQFHDFMEQLRTLLYSFEALAVSFGSKFLPVAERVVAVLQKAADLAIRLDNATGGVSSGLLIAAGGLGTAALAKGLLGGLLGTGGGVLGGLGEGITGILGLILSPEVIGIVVAAVAGYFLLHNEKVQNVAREGYQGLTKFIGKFEGFASKAYRDFAGNLTIGYGHLIRPGENFAGGISQSDALSLLAKDTADAQAAVLRLVKGNLNANQLAALTDFVYNIGSGAFAGSTMLKDLNLGDFAGAASEFTRWSNAGGRFSAGLYNRRVAERDMFLKPVTMQQTTNIHVNSTGPDSAQDIGRTVAEEQTRVNGDLLRNLAGATQ